MTLPELTVSGGEQHIYLVHAGKRPPPDLAATAALLRPGREGQATALVGASLGTAGAEGLRECLAPALADCRRAGVRVLRLVMSAGAEGPDGTGAAPGPGAAGPLPGTVPPAARGRTATGTDSRGGVPLSAARLLCERWGIDVLAAAGVVVVVPDGTLFAPDLPGAPGGWWHYAPGQPARGVGPRLPVPDWGPALERVERDVAAGHLVEPVPAGLLVQPVQSGPESVDGLPYAVPPDPEHPLLLVGVPGGPPVSAEALADVIAALPGQVRGAVRLLSADGRSVVAIGEAVANLLGTEVQVANGLPVLLDGPGPDGAGAAVLLVGADGAPAWRPYVEAATCLPEVGGRRRPPRTEAWRSPVTGLSGGTGPGVLQLDRRWQVTVTLTGLWVGPRGSEPPADVASRPVDPQVVAIDLGSPGRSMDSSLWPVLERLFGNLEPDVRSRALIRVHGVLGLDGISPLRRLAVRHSLSLLAQERESARESDRKSVRVAPRGAAAVAHADPATQPSTPRVITGSESAAVKAPDRNGHTAGTALHPGADDGADADADEVETAGAAGLGIESAAVKAPDRNGHTAGTALHAGADDGADADDDDVETAGAAGLGIGRLAPPPPVLVPVGMSALSPESTARATSTTVTVTSRHADPGQGPSAVPWPSTAAPTTATGTTSGPVAGAAAAAGTSAGRMTFIGTGTGTGTAAGANAATVTPAPGRAAATATGTGTPTGTTTGAATGGGGATGAAGAGFGTATLTAVGTGAGRPTGAATAVGTEAVPGPSARTAVAPAEAGPAPGPAPGAAASRSTGPAPGDASAPGASTVLSERGTDAPPPVVSADGPGGPVPPPPVLPAEPDNLPPYGPVDATDEDREALRAYLASFWDQHVSAVTRAVTRMPGLRTGEAAGGEVSGALIADLAAVHAYFTAVDERKLREALADGDQQALVFLRCLASGLRRLPSYRGTALRAAEPPGVPSRQANPLLSAANPLVGAEVGEIVPVRARALDSATPAPAADHCLIWSMTGRRTAALLVGEPTADAVGGGGDFVVFSPAARFRVLRVTRHGDTTVTLLREMSEHAPVTEPGRLAAADEAVLHRLLAALDRYEAAGPAGRTGAGPIGPRPPRYASPAP